MKRSHQILLGSGLAVFVVACWFAYRAWMLSQRFDSLDMEGRGQFGDMFGGLNTLFAGLAFAGIIFTIFLQMKELALQREELRMTRDELKRTAEANEKAANALAEQIKNQLLAARISGLSAMLASYDAALTSTGDYLPPSVPAGGDQYNSSKRNLREQRNKAISELKILLEPAADSSSGEGE
jgi:hypothetical protein